MIKLVRMVCFGLVFATYVVCGIALNCLGEEHETLRVVSHVLLVFSSFGGVYITIFAGIESKTDKDAKAYKEGYNAGRISGKGEGFREGYVAAYEAEGMKALHNLRTKVSEEALNGSKLADLI